MKAIKETMAFSGEAEETPIVEVGIHKCVGSLNHGRPNLIIKQGNQEVRISPETLQSILSWYHA